MGTLLQVFLCLRPRTPYPLPLHTVDVSFAQGRGEGRELNQREKVRGAKVHKLGRKYQHDGLHLQSINFDKHLPLQVNFLR